MPKRAKTPPIEDDAKYLTVVRPYPAHPNMELEEHRREFARLCSLSSLVSSGVHQGLEYADGVDLASTSPGEVSREERASMSSANQRASTAFTYSSQSVLRHCDRGAGPCASVVQEVTVFEMDAEVKTGPRWTRCDVSPTERGGPGGKSK
ncbi:hypothetical protein NUW54_g10903 [Trametes sanguinea]|uniref:Uncharacterized protein n=1 Tax=Trametes sanguinea TaxID=158606 RepID=A0ACC1NS21_9APHY|nr:hypothetical protein NUW54_g10903 [Trametes sanguinea]